MPIAPTIRPPFTGPQNRLYYHVLFWLAYYSFAALISLTIHHIYEPKFYWILFTMLPPDMLLVYFNLYWLIPKFLFKRKFITYAILLLIAILAQSVLYVWLHRLYAQGGAKAYEEVKNIEVRTIAMQTLNAIYVLGLTMGLKFVKDRMISDQRWQEKERRHAETELNLLKTQIHPHFFFNTLNNLYSLTIQRSDLAPGIVLRLSDLMSYMLYDSTAPEVPLDKEIATLENYIAIEKLRFGQRLTLDFLKAGNFSPVRIPPLLLLAFVENSFKHSWKDHIHAVHIHIDCRIVDNLLFFHITNPMPDPQLTAAAPTWTQQPSAPPAGIGLKNVIRRLDLLYGPAYSLDLDDTKGIFSVHLKIPIT